MKTGNKGITLIALIITIIVMLILVGATINVVIKSNLIETAIETRDNYETKKQEEATLQKVTIDGVEYDSIEQYRKQSTCKHEYSEGVCTKCGKSQGCVHNYNEDNKCTKCGVVILTVGDLNNTHEGATITNYNPNYDYEKGELKEPRTYVWPTDDEYKFSSDGYDGDWIVLGRASRNLGDSCLIMTSKEPIYPIKQSDNSQGEFRIYDKDEGLEGESGYDYWLDQAAYIYGHYVFYDEEFTNEDIAPCSVDFYNLFNGDIGNWTGAAEISNEVWCSGKYFVSTMNVAVGGIGNAVIYADEGNAYYMDIDDNSITKTYAGLKPIVALPDDVLVEWNATAKTLTIITDNENIHLAEVCSDGICPECSGTR